MNEKRTSMIAVCLAAVLALAPAVSFAQSATTFSGEAVALKANALGVSVALADTGALPSSGGNLSTSLASTNIAGIVAADARSEGTRLNSSHSSISYAVFCLKKKKNNNIKHITTQN